MSKRRLHKALADLGVASRRHSEQLIVAGRVAVNGATVVVPQTLVDPAHDAIAVDGKRLSKEPPKFYYAVNKPAGFICSSAPEHTRRAIDLVPHPDMRLFTVGRLDKDTTGLLIVTNDGDFANRVAHPSARIEKEYLAKVDKELTHDNLVRIAKGCFVEGTYVKPHRVAKVRRSTVKIVVGEGRKREIRTLLERAGLEVYQLTRIRIGSLTLGTLPEGAYRKLTATERELLCLPKPKKGQGSGKAAKPRRAKGAATTADAPPPEDGSAAGDVYPS